jgi:hypothetical protein
MISNEAKLVDHRPKTVPPGEPPGFDDEASQTAGRLDVRVDRLGKIDEVVAPDGRFGRTCRMECSASRSYSIIYRTLTPSE